MPTQQFSDISWGEQVNCMAYERGVQQLKIVENTKK
jgi:hypothetical protein